MSIKAMSWVWEHSEQKGARLLMLLAIADRCDDFGECYPGHRRLAEKARIAKSSAAKSIKTLEEAGELSVTIHGGIKTTHGKTNRYYLRKYRDSLGLETPDGNRSEYVTYDGVSKRIPQEVDENTPQEVDKMIPYPSGYPSVDSSEKDSPQQKSAAEQSSDLDSHDCNDCHNGVHYCKNCQEKHKGERFFCAVCECDIDGSIHQPVLFKYGEACRSCFNVWVHDGSKALDGHGDAMWTKYEIDKDATLHCVKCEGAIDVVCYGYRGIDKSEYPINSVLCPGCYLEQCEGGHDEPPDNLEQLTNGETNVLEFLTRRENGAMHDDVYTHARCTTNTIHRLQSRLYIEPVVFDDMLMLAITDTGRAALEAHKAQEANMQRWQQASDNGQIRERTFDDGCDKCGGKVKPGSDAKCTVCGHFNLLCIIDITMQKNDNDKQLTAEQCSGPECFESQQITPEEKTGALCEVVAEEDPQDAKPKAPKKARKASADTLMKNALVAAMGFKQEDVTCWGEYQSASKKLRAAKFPVEDVPALYTFSRTLAKHCNYKFKSPMQLAKDLPDFRKAQRKTQQHTKTEVADLGPMNPSAGVIRQAESE